MLGYLTFFRSHTNPPTLTTVYPQTVYPVKNLELDAGMAADAGQKTRPTAEQLADKFLILELRDLLNQAPTLEDKALVQKALDIRLNRAKALEISNDFETNMKRALK